MANAITLFRLILVPVFFALLIWPDSAGAKPAFFVFMFAALTDLVDGYVARNLGRVTTFGRYLDPVADWALIIGAIIGLSIRGDIPTWSGVALLAREGAILAGYGLVLGLRKPVVKINLFGRVANFYLMSSMVLLLFGRAFAPGQFYLWLFYLGVVLYVASGMVYIIQEVTLLSGRAKEDK